MVSSMKIWRLRARCGSDFIQRWSSSPALATLHPAKSGPISSTAQRLTLTDPEGNTTTWVYDNLNRVIEETNELDDTRYFSYDANSNLVQKIDCDDRYTEYEYDALDRLIEERWLDETDDTTVIHTIDWVYDAASQLTDAGDSFAEYEYSYDGLGRATSIVADIAGLTPVVTLAQFFDANSRRTSLSATIGSTEDFVTEYTFDGLNRLTRITQQGIVGPGTNSVAEKRVDLAYNAAEQFSGIDRYADLAGADLVATSAYGYDGTGRLASLSHVQGGTTFAGYGFAYDAANQMTSFTNSEHASEDATFSYDDIGQLTGADRTGTADDEDFEYDANGNRVEANGDSYSTGNANRMESDGTFTFTYDAEGNTLTRTRISTDPADDYLTEYTWDHRNRLTTVTFKDNSDDVTKVVEETYDIFNRWISRTVDPDGDAGSTPLEETYFVYDGTQIALEFDGDDAADLSHRYLWGPAVDHLLADEDAGGDVRWALTDHQGTVRDVAEYDAGTDTTTVENHNTFDSFGKKTSQSSAAHDVLFGYTGRAFDKATGLQNNWHRWLKDGRWLSEDWIEDDLQNSYRYVENSSQNHTDSTGLRPLSLSEQSGISKLEALLEQVRKEIREGGEDPQLIQLERQLYSSIKEFRRLIDGQDIGTRSSAVAGLGLGCAIATQADSPVLPFADIAALVTFIGGTALIIGSHVPEVNLGGQITDFLAVVQAEIAAVFATRLKDQVDQVGDALKPYHDHMGKLGDPRGPLRQWWEKWVKDAQKALDIAKGKFDKIRECKQKEQLGQQLDELQKALDQRAAELAKQFAD